MQTLTMRVVAGKYSRRPLQIDVDNKDIRPTKDMVRQGVFNALSFDVKHRVVLDLFSGTGALGIEALSRGAHAATFIDQSKHAIQLIKTNTTFVEEPIEVMQMNYQTFLESSPKNRFDLVFLDPPYHLDILIILDQVLASGILKEEAILVLETDKPLSLVLDKSRIRTYKYGITHITIIWR